MNTRQSLFASNYASCLNATKAALDAGYSSKTAYSQGQRLLKNVEVQQVLSEEVARLREASGVTVERVVEEYRKLAFANTTDAIKVRGGWVYIEDTDDLTPDQQAAISEIRQTKEGVSVKFHSKQAALDSLGKYLGIFTDKVQVENVGPAPELRVVFGKAKEKQTEVQDD